MNMNKLKSLHKQFNSKLSITNRVTTVSSFILIDSLCVHSEPVKAKKGKSVKKVYLFKKKMKNKKIFFYFYLYL